MEALSYYEHNVPAAQIKTSATLVMYGEHDRLRDGEELLHNNISNASKVVLPGLGHIPQIEDPEPSSERCCHFCRLADYLKKLKRPSRPWLVAR